MNDMHEDARVLRIVLNQLKERESILSERLTGGGAKDFPEYREVCGSIQGLLYAQSIIQDLVRKLEQIDND